MGHKVIRHTKFFRAFTIVGATIGLLASSTFAVALGLDAAGKNNFITSELREYTARFINEGALISEATYRRGEEIEMPETPSHELDGENFYIFLGWDITGNGFIDYIPPRMYYSFTANAVYLSSGKFDLSFIDLTNMDLETLLRLMETLNLDWEQFMAIFDIDPETLMAWLMENAVLSFESSGDCEQQFVFRPDDGTLMVGSVLAGGDGERVLCSLHGLHLHLHLLLILQP